jgi:OOP family OmpA-OmpF porin
MLVLGVLGLAAWAAPGPVAGQDKPLARNYLFILDNSANMGLDENDQGLTRLKRAKDLLLRMNDLLPDLGYNVGLALTSPFEVYTALGRFDRYNFGYDIQSVYTGWRYQGKDGFSVATDMPLFWAAGGRRADLGETLEGIGPVVSRARGRTVAVVLTAGCNRQGVDPVEQAKKLYARHPAMRLHLVSYADTDRDAETLAEMAGLDPATVLVSAGDLDDEAQLREFMEAVLFGGPPEGPGRLHQERPAPDLAEGSLRRSGP